MGTVVDHLRPPCAVTVRRAFRDRAGQAHEVGERWLLRALRFEVATMSLAFDIERDGRASVFEIDLRDPQAPQNGRMREWFEVGEAPPSTGPRQVRPRSLHSGGKADPSLSDFMTAEIAEVAALAASGDLAAAEAALQAAHRLPCFAGEALQNLAQALEGAAAAVLPRNRAAAEWLYDRGIDCWYGWGSMATSGGDGAARLPSIKAALKRRRELLGS